jgi:hypothetical protein
VKIRLEEELIEGFWIVQYEGLQGNGGGVAVFTKGKVFGGDSGCTYMGEYEARDDSVRAHVTVRNFLPDVPSVLGVVGDFELVIDGRVEGKVIRASGNLANNQAAGIALRLTKRADLPA